MKINFHANVLDSTNGKILGNISLLGESIKVNRLMGASGNLQRYKIQSGEGKLHDVWFNQEVVLMRIGDIQQQVKIATYPTDGENQGYLDLIPGTREYCQIKEPSHLRTQIRRGLALIQTLIGT